MTTKTMKIGLAGAVLALASAGWGWIDSVGVDGTDIARQQAADDDGQFIQDAAKFARRARRLGSRPNSPFALTCQLTPSAIGNKANAAQPVRLKPCSWYWTGHQSHPWQLRIESDGDA